MMRDPEVGSGPLHICVEEVRAQRTAVQRVKRELFGVDRTPKGRYTREFESEFTHFDGPISYAGLLAECAAADLIYIGDYHALPQAQEFEAKLLTDLKREGHELMVGVELIYHRDQRNLERWLQRRMSEKEFLRRIRYNLEWGYDWDSFRDIFEVCRRHRIKVYGVDTDPRLGLRRIRERDESVAHNLAELLQRHPRKKLVVIFGESHLASNHLPDALMRVVPRSRNLRTVTVLQNQDSLYFQAVSRGYQGLEAVRVRDGVFCVFNSIPLAKYQAYRQVLERWSQTDPEGEVRGRASVVADLVDCLLSFLGINKHTYKVRSRDYVETLYEAYPEIFMRRSPREIRRIMKFKQVIARHRPEILRHLQSRSCCYVREMNAIFIQRWDFGRISEVVSRFVNVALKGQHGSSFLLTHRKVDRFFVKIIEEALGYFGSKIINHNRTFIKEEDFLASTPGSLAKVSSLFGLKGGSVKRLQGFYRRLKEFEAGDIERKRPPLWLSRLLRNGGRIKGALSDLAGHFLGERLHEDYHEGVLSLPAIRKLFSRSFTDQPAFKTYLLVLRRNYGKLG